MAFHLLDMEQWERRTHYAAYTTFLPVNWNLTAQIDITCLHKMVRARHLRFYPVMLYLATTAVNRIRAFRMAYDAEGRLGFYDSMHPGYTIFHPDDQTFSDIWSTYDADFAQFYQTVVQDMAEWKDAKGYQTKPQRPANCVPMSMVPWVAFQSCSFDIPFQSRMLQPVITFGKYVTQAETTMIPVAVFANHAVADGWHGAQLFEELQTLANHPEAWMSVPSCGSVELADVKPYQETKREKEIRRSAHD